MIQQLQAPAMRGKPNSESVRIDREVLRRARVVAAFLGMTLPEYLASRLDGLVTDELKQHAKKAIEE